MNKGLLKSWNDEKGFDFIKSSTLQHETFIHISSLKHMSRKPKVGYIIYSLMKLITFGIVFSIVFSIGFSVYKTGFLNTKQTPVVTNANLESFMPASSSSITKTEQAFRCDGRQHCSQMTSYVEALFFIQHCPDTKMDGDKDGEPCERQFGNR